MEKTGPCVPVSVCVQVLTLNMENKACAEFSSPPPHKNSGMTVAYHSTSGTSPINPTYNTMWPPSYKLFYKPHISIINHLVIVGVVCTNLYSYRKRGPHIEHIFYICCRTKTCIEDSQSQSAYVQEVLVPTNRRLASRISFL